MSFVLGTVLGVVLSVAAVGCLLRAVAFDTPGEIEGGMKLWGNESDNIYAMSLRAVTAYAAKVANASRCDKWDQKRRLTTTNEFREWLDSDGNEGIVFSHTVAKAFVAEELAVIPPLLNTVEEIRAWKHNESIIGAPTRAAVTKFSEERIDEWLMNPAAPIIRLFITPIFIIQAALETLLETPPLRAFLLACFIGLALVAWRSAEIEYKKYFSDKNKLRRFRRASPPDDWLTLDKCLRRHPDEWSVPAKYLEGAAEPTRVVGTFTSQPLVIRDVCGGTARLTLEYGMTNNAMDGTFVFKKNDSGDSIRRNMVEDMCTEVEEDVRWLLAHKQVDGKLNSERTYHIEDIDEMHVYRASNIRWTPDPAVPTPCPDTDCCTATTPCPDTVCPAATPCPRETVH